MSQDKVGPPWALALLLTGAFTIFFVSHNARVESSDIDIREVVAAEMPYWLEPGEYQVCDLIEALDYEDCSANLCWAWLEGDNITLQSMNWRMGWEDPGHYDFQDADERLNEAMVKLDCLPDTPCGITTLDWIRARERYHVVRLFRHQSYDDEDIYYPFLFM